MDAPETMTGLWGARVRVNREILRWGRRLPVGHTGTITSAWNGGDHTFDTRRECPVVLDDYTQVAGILWSDIDLGESLIPTEESASTCR